MKSQQDTTTSVKRARLAVGFSISTLRHIADLLSDPRGQVTITRGTRSHFTRQLRRIKTAIDAHAV